MALPVKFNFMLLVICISSMLIHNSSQRNDDELYNWCINTDSTRVKVIIGDVDVPYNSSSELKKVLETDPEVLVNIGRLFNADPETLKKLRLVAVHILCEDSKYDENQFITLVLNAEPETLVNLEHSDKELKFKDSKDDKKQMIKLALYADVETLVNLARAEEQLKKDSKDDDGSEKSIYQDEGGKSKNEVLSTHPEVLVNIGRLFNANPETLEKLRLGTCHLIVSLAGYNESLQPPAWCKRVYNPTTTTLSSSGSEDGKKKMMKLELDVDPETLINLAWRTKQQYPSPAADTKDDKKQMIKLELNADIETLVNLVRAEEQLKKGTQQPPQ